MKDNNSDKISSIEEANARYFCEQVSELYKECVSREDFSEFSNFIDFWEATKCPPNKSKNFEKLCVNYDWGINFEK